MSVDYGEWDGSHLDRPLNELYVDKSDQLIADNEKQFRAICLYRDFDKTHLRARPLLDPTPDAPTDDDAVVWPGSDNYDLYDWFNMYDHYSDGTLDSEAKSNNGDLLNNIEQYPERTAELAWYVCRESDDREHKIRRLVAYNFPYSLNPYPIYDVPADPLT
jgi:hypothetical protein